MVPFSPASIFAWEKRGPRRGLKSPQLKSNRPSTMGRYALITAGAVEMQGGIPIIRGSEIVGAIGVSGADSSTDVPIAETALAEAMP